MLAAIGSKNLSAVLLVLLLAACGDDGSAVGGNGEGGPSETGAGGSGGEASVGGGATTQATIQFFVNERPHDPGNKEQATTRAGYTDPIRVVGGGLVPGSTVRFDILRRLRGPCVGTARKLRRVDRRDWPASLDPQRVHAEQQGGRQLSRRRLDLRVLRRGGLAVVTAPMSRSGPAANIAE